MPGYVREFVLTQEVDEVSKMEEGVEVFSEEKEHFGVPWKMSVKRAENFLNLLLYCLPPDRSKEWSIEIERTFKLISVKGKTFENTRTCYNKNTDTKCGHRPNQFISWNDLINDYVVDDKFTIQVHVKILKMTGIEKKKLRSFDESRKQFSDVVLVVDDEKFHVSKLFLGGQSSYFEALFLRNVSESEQTEVKLSDVSSKDFHHFLELLHGEPAIDDTTVDGILKLSDMYDAQTAVRRCEEYLIEKSDKTMKEKLELSKKYKLENLKNNCLLNIKTVDDIKSVLPGYLSELEPDVSNALFQKLLSFH